MTAPLGPHRRHRRGDPCPVCGGDNCVTFDDTGQTLCLRAESPHRTRTGIGWLHGDPDDWRDHPPPPRPPTPEPPPPDPALVDRGLRLILDRCPLAPVHRDELRRRGLSDAEVDALPVGSLPPSGAARDAVAADLVAELGPEAYGAIPGLFMRGGNAALAGYPGLLIGVLQGERLVGLVVRPDDPAVRDDGKKYMWISSGEKPGGRGSGAKCAVLGEPGPRAIVVEGILKGMIVHARLGLPVVAIPGAGITAAVAGHLAELGATEAGTAYDNDRATNPTVAKHEADLHRDLDAAGFGVHRLTWPAQHKGLDDALAAGVLPMVEPVAPAAQASCADLRASYRALSDLHSAVMALLGNGDINPAERIAAVMLLKDLAVAAERAEPGAEVHVPIKKIAEDAGLSTSTTAAAIKTLETGLIRPGPGGGSGPDPDAQPVRLFTKRVRWANGDVNRATGEKRDVKKSYFVRESTRPLAADLRELAGAAKVDGRKHGGRPDRGGCQDHPDAPVIVRTTRHCSVCDATLGPVRERTEPGAGVNEHDADLLSTPSSENVPIRTVNHSTYHNGPTGRPLAPDSAERIAAARADHIARTAKSAPPPQPAQAILEAADHEQDPAAFRRDLDQLGRVLGADERAAGRAAPKPRSGTRPPPPGDEAGDDLWTAAGWRRDGRTGP